VVPRGVAGQASQPDASSNDLDLQALKEQRFRELKRQMEILNQLSEMPRRPATFPNEQGESIESGVVETESAPDLLQQRIREGRQASPPNGAPEKIRQPAIPLQLVPANESSGSQESPAPQIVVEGTIDRFALATSLFGTGQTETCLDVLNHTDLKQLSREDQVWAEYLIACCHRRAGRLDQAKQCYRRLLAEKDVDWIGELASWWLTEIDEKAKLQDDIQRLAKTLAAWGDEIDSLNRQSAPAETP